jgi:hypothetical protein
MDLLLLGETISAAAGGQTHTGYWMPAGGNDGVGGFEVFFGSVENAFVAHLDTKSSDQSDAAATSIGSASSGAVVTTTPVSLRFDVANAKDLVRYRVVSVKAGVLHLQFAQPLWQPN